VNGADVFMGVFGLTRACPHGKGPASTCSMCLGIIPRRITTDGADLLIDGEPSGRQIDHERAITARRRARK